MKFNYKKFALVSLAAAALFAGSCSKDMLETSSSQQTEIDVLKQSTDGLYTLLEGMHKLFGSPGASMTASRPFDWGQKSIDQGLDLMGEDIVTPQSGYDWFTYYYQYVSTESRTYWMPPHIWRFYYRMINNANNIIEAVDKAKGDQVSKNDLKGQALAYRAYAYLKLVNTFAPHYNSPDGPNKSGVPIYLTATTGTTVGKPKSTVKEVYEQMISDIDEAITLLQGVATRKNISHINYNVANGIAARIYLAKSDYNNAYIAANNAIAGTNFMSARELVESGFGKANNEWLWGTALTSEQYSVRGLNCFIGWYDQRTSGYANAGVYRNISRTLYTLLGDNDVRKGQFLPDDSYRQIKFLAQDPSTFDYQDLYMRAAEMQLIKAEAAAHLGNESEAASLLEELIQIRDANYNVTDRLDFFNSSAREATNAKRLLGKQTSDPFVILDEIKIQRKLELWGEGFSYEDIVRYQKGLNRPRNYTQDHSPSSAKVSNLPANDPKFIFPVPQEELDNNPNLGE
jgi:hypothetical protein